MPYDQQDEMPDDAVLVLYANGDQAAARTLTLRLTPRAFAQAFRMLGDRAEAEDVAQEAMIRLWKHRETVAPGAAKSWMLTTTHRLCLDRLRRRGRWKETSIETPGAEQPSPDASPERSAGARQAVATLGKALESLGPQDRAVVVLREIEGLGYREIAESLDVPLGTLKARLHRARERLRQRLVSAGVTP